MRTQRTRYRVSVAQAQGTALPKTIIKEEITPSVDTHKATQRTLSHLRLYERNKDRRNVASVIDIGSRTKNEQEKLALEYLNYVTLCIETSTRPKRFHRWVKQKTFYTRHIERQTKDILYGNELTKYF